MTLPTQKKWYEEWFDSEYYLKLYSHRNKIEAEACIDIIQRATQSHPTETNKVRVLDIACGPGRHAISLAKRGFEVTAVDLSTSLLHHAHTQAQKAKTPIKFLQLDMRSLDFNAEFDLAVQLFSSFGYFDTIEEDFAVIQGARRSLRDIGYYAIDLINPLVLEKTLIPKSTRVIDDGIKVTEERQIIDGRVEKLITIPVKKEKLQYKEAVRLYSPETIETSPTWKQDSCQHTGLATYAGLPFDRERSRRMIVINKVV